MYEDGAVDVDVAAVEYLDLGCGACYGIEPGELSICEIYGDGVYWADTVLVGSVVEVLDSSDDFGGAGDGPGAGYCADGCTVVESRRVGVVSDGSGTSLVGSV